VNSNWAPLGHEAQSAEPEDAFEMGEQHLDALAIAARSFEGFRLGQPARHVTGLLINASA
jgi:hypothetical protein